MKKLLHIQISLLFWGVFFVMGIPAQTKAAIQSSATTVLLNTVSPSSEINNAQQIWVSPTGTIFSANAGTGTNGSRLTEHSSSGGAPVNAVTVQYLNSSQVLTNARPRGVVVDPNKGLIYVAESSTTQIITYNLVNNHLDTSTPPTIVITGVSGPQGLALNVDGSKLYVANTGAGNVKIYNTADYSLIQTITLPVASNTNYPNAIAVDSSGNFYVTDYKASLASPTGNNRVFKYTASTNSLALFTSNYVDTSNSNSSDTPSGVTLDDAGNIYVLVQGNKSGGSGGIFKYNSAGVLIESLRATDAPALNKPLIGIVVTSDYKIYVSNTLGSRVQYYTQTLDAPKTPVALASGSTVNLSWTNVADTRLNSFTIRRSSSGYPVLETDGTAVASGLTATSYADTVSTDGTYYYSIFAKNTSGTYSTAANATATVDATPTAGPTLFAASLSGSNVNLSWVNPTDSDFASTRIRRSTSSYPVLVTDGSAVTSNVTSTSFTDSSLADGTYYYSIFAIDAVGNISTSATATVFIDITPTSAPTAFVANASGSNVNFSWVNPTDLDFSSVTILRNTVGYPSSITDGSVVAANLTSATSYADSGLSDGMYYYSIFAKDNFGNISIAASGSTTVDTTSTAAPTIFVSQVSGDDVALSWINPTTNDFASVTIVRSTSGYPTSTTDGTLVNSGVTVDNYSDVSLADGMYYYSIFAIDTVGNISPAATATALVDTTAPNIPTSFTVSVSGSNVNLSWVNPTDSDFSSVTIQRGTTIYPTSISDGTNISSNFTGTFLTENGLTDETYYYSIFAKDTHQNISIAAQALITIDTTAPIISGINVVPSVVDATITWTTSKNASTQVIYSTDTSYSLSTTLADTTPRVISHTVVVNNLASCTLYHFKVISIDVSSNTATSNDNNFTTSGCISPVTPVIPIIPIVVGSGGGSGGGGFSTAYSANTISSPLSTPSPVKIPNATVVQVKDDTSIKIISKTNQPTTETFTPTTPDISLTSSTTKTPLLFTRTLKLGSKGDDVKALQQFLNTHGFILKKYGPGSPGQETTAFGPATVKALKRFQEAHAEQILKPLKLRQGNGVLGVATMKVLNEYGDSESIKKL